MALRLSLIDPARAHLDETVNGADPNKDSRVTSAELSTALRGETPEAKSALFSAWRDGYEIGHRSPSRTRVREQLAAAAEALKAGDTNHSGVLSKAELEKIDSETAQRLAFYAAVPQDQVTPAQVGAALKAALGVELTPEILKTRTVNGAPHVEIRASNGAAELALAKSGTGWRIDSAHFTESPTVVDPELKDSFERQLHDDFGFVDPEVKAVGHGPGTGGITRWQLQVESGKPSARKTEAVQLEYGSSGTAKLGTFQYNADSAQEQALQLATEATLELTRQAGGDELAQLEVFLKRDKLQPSDAESIALADSPIGFEPSHEVQFQVPPLWGDNVGYATFDKKTGAGRADTFN